MKHFKLLYFIPIIISISCNSFEDVNLEEIAPTTLIEKPQKLLSNVNWDDFFEIKEIIVIPESEGIFIADVNRAEIYEDWIFMLDVEYRNEIFSFNRNTGVLKKVAVKGEGPGEYSVLEDFFINRHEKCLELINNRGGILEIIKYTFDWKFLSAKKYSNLWALSTFLLPDGNYIMASQGQNTSSNDDFVDFQIFDKEGKILRNISRTPKILNRWYTPLGMPLSYSQDGTIVSSAKSTPYVFEFFDKDSLVIYDLQFDEKFIDKQHYNSAEEYDFWYNYNQPMYHTIDRVVKLGDSYYYRVVFKDKIRFGLFTPSTQQHILLTTFGSGPLGLPILLGGATGRVDDNVIFYLDPEQLNEIFLNNAMINPIPN